MANTEGTEIGTVQMPAEALKTLNRLADLGIELNQCRVAAQRKLDEALEHNRKLTLKVQELGRYRETRDVENEVAISTVNRMTTESGEIPVLRCCPFCRSGDIEFRRFSGNKWQCFCVKCESYGPSAMTKKWAVITWNTRKG